MGISGAVKPVVCMGKGCGGPYGYENGRSPVLSVWHWPGLGAGVVFSESWLIWICTSLFSTVFSFFRIVIKGNLPVTGMAIHTLMESVLLSLLDNH